MGFENSKQYSSKELEEIEKMRKRVLNMDGADAKYRPLAQEIAEEEKGQREKYKDKLSREDADILGDNKSTDILAIKEREKELERTQKRLTETEEKSLIDPLTGLGNREALKKISTPILMMGREKREGARKGDFKERREPPVHSLIILDLDFFKKINDTYGHPVGDKVLISAARAVEGAVRKGGSTYRYGGEELVVFLPNTNLEDAKEVAERIRKKIENIDIEIDKEVKIKITASLGCSSTDQISRDTPKDKTLEALIENSDKALYRAKEFSKDGKAGEGRNRVSIFESEVDSNNK